MEIKGKKNTAVCYAKVIEKVAEEQIRRMCDYDLTEGSRIRIMPDVHAGKGCTIGTTMTVTDKVCPNIVGVDIGCGMYTTKLTGSVLDFERIDAACHEIPSGMNVWDECVVEFNFSALRCYDLLKDISRLRRSLGTLGGGNHFIEIDRTSDGEHYLIIHSGSRNLGKQVAEIYQKAAVELHTNVSDYQKERDTLIERYKTEGRSAELASVLGKLKQEYRIRSTDVPEDLCWLHGEALADYLHDVEICQLFARMSREKMAELILQRIGMNAEEGFHTIHNYIDTNEMILRKGAIAAHKGEKVLIPINMRDGSILAVGRGNPEWNYSAPHGAGRIMSRKKAKTTLSLKEYIKQMEGIYTTSVNERTLDEAPMSYKSLSDIIDVVASTVDIIELMKPVYNFKASEDDAPWKK